MTTLQQEYVMAAERLGCELSDFKFADGEVRWSWLFGRRSSADQYGITFTSKEDAAEHFLSSREAQNARAADHRRASRK